MALTVDSELLKAFEEQLDPAKPDESSVPATVLGYGEVSTAFEIPSISTDVACKRMPLFEDLAEVDEYINLYFRYNEMLQTKIGIRVPEYGAQAVVADKGRPVLYLLQRKLPSNSMCNNIIHTIDDEAVITLVLRILTELNKVWEFNKNNHPETEVGLDGQISNWAAIASNSGMTFGLDTTDLIYIDTSTPFIRDTGAEQLDALLFLKPAPPILRWILKKLYLQEILDRYYDLRKVTIDLVANFYKEQRSELIPILIPAINDYLTSKASIPDIAPIDEKEVQKYYKDDAATWRLYLRSRKLHRFIKSKILRRSYPFILPGKIQR
ncbi:MAG: DUF6206 family protein [Candidatus Thorarchaeota archaeon]